MRKDDNGDPIEDGIAHYIAEYVLNSSPPARPAQHCSSPQPDLGTLCWNEVPGL